MMTDTSTGSAAGDVKIDAGRPLNMATGTRPCVLHANGWEKLPLINLVEKAGLVSAADLQSMKDLKKDAELQKV